MLNSKQLIEKTGISRATLNNYVALGILPNPIVKPPESDATKATRLGYFPDEALERIQLVQKLKKVGNSKRRMSLKKRKRRMRSLPPYSRVSSMSRRRMMAKVSSNLSKF